MSDMRNWAVLEGDRLKILALLSIHDYCKKHSTFLSGIFSRNTWVVNVKKKALSKMKDIHNIVLSVC